MFPFRRTALSFAMFGLLALTCLWNPSPSQAQRRDPYEAIRKKMVDEELAGEGIQNERVLQAMRSVPRHLFVRPELRRYAYYDQALDIGHKQTISPPFIVAYMTEVIDPQPEDRVLEIGTGSGYQAAVLSGLVKEVYTIEIIDSLGKQAARLLHRLGYDNVHARIGDGYQGWPDEAPFDKIIVTCSPEKVPEPLVEQLKEGGKMIIPLGERYQQVFHLLEKRNGNLVKKKLLPTLFVPMTGKSEQLREIKPDPNHPRIVNGGFEKATVEAGKADGWHYQRRSTLIRENAPEGQQYICFQNDDPGRNAHMLQGLALNGRAVRSVRISLKIRLKEIEFGKESHQRPSLIIHFFDVRRLPIGQQMLGPWSTSTERWQEVSQNIPIPRNTKEAIIQVGLNGATGELCLDDLRLIPQDR